MNKHLTSFLAVVLLTVPLIAEAAVVPAVKGVEVEQRGSNVVVSWEEVRGDIAYYRVYYSTVSILDNDGLFDDFEVTEGNETQLEIVPRSGSQAFYAAVIAVMQNGDESEFFVDEAGIALSDTPVVPGGNTSSAPPPAQSSSAAPPPPPASSSSAPASSSAPSMPAVALLSVEAVSPTELKAEFSAPVTVDQARAPEGLRITDRKNRPLVITSIAINGSIITINTQEQVKGAVYRVMFSEPFEGKNGGALDEVDRSLLVTGHADGKEDVTAGNNPNREVDPYNPPDVENVQMTPELNENGTYVLTVEWEINNTPGDIAYYIIWQTRDGQNFAQPSVLPAEIRGVQLPGVTAGFYGMYIQTMNVYGYMSPGVFQYVTLPQYIPGYGFYGAALTGQVDLTGVQNTNVNTEGASEFEPTEGFAVLEAEGESEPAETIELPDQALQSAAPVRINWRNAAKLAAMVAGAFVLILGIVLLAKPKSSNE